LAFGPKLDQRHRQILSRVQPVKHYRAFLIDDDGHYSGQRDLACIDDADAKSPAAVLARLSSIELWRLDRRVATFAAPTRRLGGAI
jgi:hypothetical protein